MLRISFLPLNFFSKIWSLAPNFAFLVDNFPTGGFSDYPKFTGEFNCPPLPWRRCLWMWTAIFVSVGMWSLHDLNLKCVTFCRCLLGESCHTFVLRWQILSCFADISIAFSVCARFVSALKMATQISQICCAKSTTFVFAQHVCFSVAFSRWTYIYFLIFCCISVCSGNASVAIIRVKRDTKPAVLSVPRVTFSPQEPTSTSTDRCSLQCRKKAYHSLPHWPQIGTVTRTNNTFECFILTVRCAANNVWMFVCLSHQHCQWCRVGSIPPKL